MQLAQHGKPLYTAAPNPTGGMILSGPPQYFQQQPQPQQLIYPQAPVPSLTAPVTAFYPSLQMPQQGKPLYTGTATNPAGMLISTPPQQQQYLPQQQPQQPQPPSQLMYPHGPAAPPAPTPPTSVYSTVQMPQQGKPLYTVTATNPAAGMIVPTPPQNVQQQSQVRERFLKFSPTNFLTYFTYILAIYPRKFH